MSAVSRSCAIFLQISGSNTGQSSKRGQAGVPISFIGSYDDTIRPQGANPPEPIAPPPPEPLPFVSEDVMMEVNVLDMPPPDGEPETTGWLLLPIMLLLFGAGA